MIAASLDSITCRKETPRAALSASALASLMSVTASRGPLVRWETPRVG